MRVMTWYIIYNCYHSIRVEDISNQRCTLPLTQHTLMILYLCIMPKTQAFDDSSSWTGSSMRLAGALTRLSERNMLRTATPPIVVCIPCAEGTFLPGMPRRHGEYGDYNHPVSQAHGVFVATTLHPYIMNRFRVKDGPEHISTIGCSLGGQASLQLVLRCPEVRCCNRIIPDS